MRRQAGEWLIKLGAGREVKHFAIFPGAEMAVIDVLDRCLISNAMPKPPMRTWDAKT